jgi:hypothetical protein
LPVLLPLLSTARAACHQERVFQRFALLTLGLVITLGRHQLTKVLASLGAGQTDWSAWYRVFTVPRVDVLGLQRTLLGQVLRHVPKHRLLPVVLDATQLPRSSRRFPGVGWTHAPRTPPFRRGIHRAQRWELLSWLTPRSASGDCRAIPLRPALIRSPTSQPCGDIPAQPEWQAGLALLSWLRAELVRCGHARQRLLVLGDGAYSTAKLWAALPHQVTLLARCAKNRALYALPPVPMPGTRGRPRQYGDRGPTPDATLRTTTAWQTTTLMVRGRPRTLRFTVTGPWLVQGAAAVPLFLLVVRGVQATPRHRQRAPVWYLVNAHRDAKGRWVLPLPVPQLLGWAWQRWEVEVMHRELKGGFGLGEQQAWTPTATTTVTAWVVWTYALLVLTGYRVWGLGPGPIPTLGRWHTARRWSLGRLWQGVRQELWQDADLSPGWTRSPDAWAEMAAWIATRTTAPQAAHRL